MVQYKICVKTTTGQILTYKVNSYEIVENTLIRFKDLKYNIFKLYDCRNCEIEEVSENA